MDNDDQPASETGTTTGRSRAPLPSSALAGSMIGAEGTGPVLRLVSKERRVEPSVGLRLTIEITADQRLPGRPPSDLHPVTDAIDAGALSDLLRAAETAASRGLAPGLVLGCGVLEWEVDATVVRTPVSLVPISLEKDGTVLVLGPTMANPALDELLDERGITRPAGLIPTTWPAPEDETPWRYSRKELLIFVADDIDLHVSELVRETDPLPIDESTPETPEPVSAPTLVDADLQQRTAIAAARDAAGLVVRGASGSGRTQTAAAIAADRVHYGETVLIASDRLDSLHQIERSLAAVGLDELLIPLHRLADHELSEPPSVLPGRPDKEEVALETKLSAVAKRLQSAMEAGEGIRRPGRSLAEAINEVMSTSDEASPTATGVDRNLSETSITEVTSAVRTLMANHAGSPERDGVWHGAVGRQALGSKADAMLVLLDGAKAALERLATSATTESGRIGMGWADRPSDAPKLARLGFLLNEPLPSRPEWLTAPSLTPLQEAVSELRTTSTSYEEAVDNARLTAGETWKEIDPTIHAPVVEARSGASTWTPSESATVHDLRRVSEFLASNRRNFADLERHGVSLFTRLGAGHLPITVDRLPDLVELGELAHASVRPESSWLQADSSESLETSVSQLRLMVNETRIAAKRVETIFTPKILDLDLRELRNQLGEQGMLRRLTAAQRANRAALIDATLEGRLDESAVGALPDAIAWQDAHRRLQQAERSQPELVGSSHYRGLATDFAQFDQALAVHRRIKTLAGNDIRPSDLVAIFSQTSVPDPALVDAAAQVRSLLDTWVVEARRTLGADLIDTLPVAGLGTWCEDTISLIDASATAAEQLDGPSARIRPALERLEAVDAVHRTWDEIQSSDHNTSRLLGGDIPRSEQARAKLGGGLEWTDAVRTIVNRPITLDEAKQFLTLEASETSLADDVIEWDRHSAWISRWFRIEDRQRVDSALNSTYQEARAFLEQLRVQRPKLSVLLERERAREIAERFGLETLPAWAHARDFAAPEAAAAARRQMLRAWIDVVMQREETQLLGSEVDPIEGIAETYRRQHDELRRYRIDRAREVAVDRRALINPDARMSGAIAMLGRAARLLADGLRPDVIILDLSYPTDPAVIDALLRAGRRRRVLLTNDPDASLTAAVEITLGTDHRSMHPALGVGDDAISRVYPSADAAARPIRVVTVARSAIAQRIADGVATKLRADIHPSDVMVVIPDDKARSEIKRALRRHVSGWTLGTAVELAGRSAAHVLVWLPAIGGNDQLAASLAFSSMSADLFVDETNAALLEVARERAVFGTRFLEHPTSDDADPIVIRLRDRFAAQGITVRYPPAGVSCVDLIVDRGNSLRPIALELDTSAARDVDLRYRQNAERMNERGWHHELVSVARLWQDEDAEMARLLKVVAAGDLARSATGRSPSRSHAAVTSAQLPQSVPPPGVPKPAEQARVPAASGSTLPVAVPPPPAPPSAARPSTLAPSSADPTTADAPLSMLPDWARLYRPADIATPAKSLEMFGETPHAEIEETILDIVELEEPVHLARVIRRTAISRGQSPADALAARSIQGVLRELMDDAVEVDDDGFVVFLDIDPDNPAPANSPRVPSDDSETQRPVAEVPPAELKSALGNLAKDAPASRRSLVVQMAELYRWDATSADLAARLDDLLDLLIGDGELSENADRIVGPPMGGTSAGSIGSAARA